MKKTNIFHLQLNDREKKQIEASINLINKILGQDLVAIYLYGSAVVGGLQKYSDIDLFVVSNRPTTTEERSRLVESLLKISGLYMKDKNLPIELTIVEKAVINPWRFPPRFDFQYGEWLREQFEQGSIEPWVSKEMPDLAILITQILQNSFTLAGPPPNQVFCAIPYKDFIAALAEALPNLMSELKSDTRNALLTIARIWSTLETNKIYSKPAAADWAISHLAEQFHPVMKRAKEICTGKAQEYWGDIQESIEPCADFMITNANKKILTITLTNDFNKAIKAA